MHIVEYPAPPVTSPVFALAATPRYRHGGGDGDYLFARITHGALLPDGGSVVVDAVGGGQNALRISPDGSVYTVLATPGQGPTEIRAVTSVLPLGGDTVLLEDDGNGKFVLLSGDSVVGSISYANRVDIRMLGVVGVADSGQLLMASDGFPINFQQDWLPGWMVRMDLATLRTDTVASFDLAAFLADWSQWTPFHPQGVITASGGTFVHARVDLPILHWRGEDGALHQVLRWVSGEQQLVERSPEDERRALREELRRLNPTLADPDLDRLLERRLEDRRPSQGDAPPLFGLIHGDGEGGVWIASFDPITPGRSSRYFVVSRDGSWRGTIELPPDVRILDIRGPLVLVVMKDELGVEGVGVYDIEGMRE